MEIFKTPIRIGNKVIKNRIVLPPMATFGMTGEDGKVSDDTIRHYSAYAENDVGLIITEACAVRKMNEPRGTIAAYDESGLMGLSAISASTKKNGSVSVMQLINTGLSIMKENSIAQISKEDFLSYQSDFIKTAKIVDKAGFDGIELHAANGFYLNQVLQRNDRTEADGYGNTIENKAEYIAEIIRQIRTDVGADFIIGVRLGALDTDEETVTAAGIFENAGADYIHISFGCGGPKTVNGIDHRSVLAGIVKKAINIPVICVGGYKTAEQIENALKTGYGDLVAVGTAQLADHGFAKKILNDEAPTPCLKCKKCAWQTDGRKCPLAKDIFR